MVLTQSTDHLNYHASRLLLLIAICGKSHVNDSAGSGRLPGIEGRTLLAKLDFFLRYPAYLKKAATILNKNTSDQELGLITQEELYSVESQMVRYLYGPWDHIYYSVLAYLIGKELVTIEKSEKRDTEIFCLTSTGQNIAHQITHDSTYSDLAERAATIHFLFHQYNGNKLKEFIYNNFPEIVGHKVGVKI